MRTFLKYFMASLFALLVDYCIVALSLYLNVVYIYAILMGLVGGGLVGFLLLTYWVFATNSKPYSPTRVISFLSGLLLVYCIRTFLMWIWYSFDFAQSLQYYALLGTYGVSFMANFLLQKFFFVRTQSVR